MQRHKIIIDLGNQAVHEAEQMIFSLTGRMPPYTTYEGDPSVRPPLPGEIISASRAWGVERDR